MLFHYSKFEVITWSKMNVFPFAGYKHNPLLIFKSLLFRTLLRSMPSTAFLMPYKSFWHDDEVLVYAPGRNYTVNDYKQYFEDINFKVGWYMRRDTEPLLRNLIAPEVEVHCLHGINVITSAAFKYSKSQWPDNHPDVIYGDGDGIVNQRSLHGCLRWSNQQQQKVYHQEFTGVKHTEMLENKYVIQYMISYITNITAANEHSSN